MWIERSIDGDTLKPFSHRVWSFYAFTLAIYSVKSSVFMLTTQPNIPEALFVKRLQVGDEEAFQLLVQQYHASMVRLAAVIVSEMSVAEDVVQETWLAVLKAIRHFEGRSTIKTWLFSIVMNRAKTYLKREQRHAYRSVLSLDTPEGSASEFVMPQIDAYPETIADIHEFQQTLSQTIDLLPRNQQNVIRLRHLDGFSAAEVSQQLGISDVYQRVLLHRARKQMRAKLMSY
jgi:RNA polymerase sigma-70 factor (ECF subfamily)